MDYKKALLKGKEDPTDLLITATTLNFLRICQSTMFQLKRWKLNVMNRHKLRIYIIFQFE